MRHPIQPLYADEDGTPRFKDNAIVRFLRNTSKYDLNELSLMPFSREDWEQFAQLIGYTVSGFYELPYVSDETYEQVEQMRDSLQETKN